MPLSFLVLGYLLLYFAFSPYIRIGSAAAGLLVNDSAPDFTRELGSIYDASALTSSEDTVHHSLVQIPERDTQYGEFSIQRLGLQLPLYYGDSDLALDAGAGHYASSYLPGYGGTILVAGHNQTHFNDFQYLEIGDILTIQTNYGVYEYEVVHMEVKMHDDPEAVDLGQTEKEQLVAYTCYPFDALIGITPERLFVYADKISGPVVE